MRDHFTFTAGRLLCRHIRDALAEAQIIYPSIQWHESNGLLERRFTVAGNQQELVAIQTALARWFDEIEKAASKESDDGR